MATFKTPQQIYNDIENYILAQIPEIISLEPGTPEFAIVKGIQFACSLIWTIVFSVYTSIFATTADRSALRRHMEDWGLTYTGQPTDEMRRLVLGKYRESAIGTAGWYEETAKSEYPEQITEAYFFAGRRGVNTGDLLVMNNGGDVYNDTITALQAYFDNAARKIICIDILVITYSDVYDELVELESAS